MCIFKKSVKKSHVSLKSDENNGFLNEDLHIFMTVSPWILLRRRNVSEEVAEKIKEKILYSAIFSRKACCL
jgi:hypothetical protein